MKILIVEDDSRISTPIAEDLRNQHYVVDLVENGTAALSASEDTEYDLILLDLMLPQVDGIDVCRRLRACGYKGYVLMLTARATKQDKVIGLDSGADDYLVKPFDIDELNARIRALLRRGKNVDGATLTVGDLSVDLRSCTVRFHKNDLAITPTEYRLLVHFLRNPKRVFTKNQLIEQLWDSSDVPTNAVIKAHIKGLRQKLEAAGAGSDVIETVYGFGYRLRGDAG